MQFYRILIFIFVLEFCFQGLRLLPYFPVNCKDNLLQNIILLIYFYTFIFQVTVYVRQSVWCSWCQLDTFLSPPGFESTRPIMRSGRAWLMTVSQPQPLFIGQPLGPLGSLASCTMSLGQPSSGGIYWNSSFSTPPVTRFAHKKHWTKRFALFHFCFII